VPDCKSVGVRESKRTYEYPVIIRAVNSIDTMTARVPRISWDVLERVTERILNEVEGVNRVCYDLSPKPPGTIEWE
jgi:GMP synthase (glutamine-hydrolysing)